MVTNEDVIQDGMRVVGDGDQRRRLLWVEPGTYTLELGMLPTVVILREPAYLVAIERAKVTLQDHRRARVIWEFIGYALPVASELTPAEGWVRGLVCLPLRILVGIAVFCGFVSRRRWPPPSRLLTEPDDDSEEMSEAMSEANNALTEGQS